MRRVDFAAAALLGVMGLTNAQPASAQLPSKPAPKGMAQIATSGSGRILTSKMGGTSSARKMLMALKMVAGGYFDKPLTVTRIFADRADQNLQAAFTATLKGIPVRGVASVTMAGESGQGTLLFDRASAFTKSFRTLAAGQGGGGKATSGGKTAVKLIPTVSPDGLTRISLPPGFRIVDCYKGTLDITGPNNAVMALGAAAVCTRKEAMGMFPGMPGVDFNDPVRAMLDYVAYSARKNGNHTTVQILDAKPVPNWSSGRAAMVRYRLTINGYVFECFGLFSIAQTDINQALFYQSYMVAHSDTYRTQLPAMIQAWSTYNISSSVFRERMMAAAQSMRGVNDIITGSYDNQQKTYARVNEAWSDYIRDQGTWSNPNDGSRYKISNNALGGGIPMQNGTVLEPVPLGDL